MREIDTGGQAFPTSEGAYSESVSGMTLRDYFAANAMASIMTHEAPVEKGPKDAYANLASSSYQIADAMLKERTK